MTKGAAAGHGALAKDGPNDGELAAFSVKLQRHKHRRTLPDFAVETVAPKPFHYDVVGLAKQ